MDIVVQIPAYEEGRSVYVTATKIVKQALPPGVSLDCQAWVTLSPPDKELCDTWQSAMGAEGVDVYEAPIGKLSARNAAHQHALDQGYDVIFSWDADAPPTHDTVLAEMIESFDHEPTPSCVNSRPVSGHTGDLFGYVVNLFAAFEDIIVPHVNGQCHAMTAEAWAHAGPFDDSIDQTDIAEVRAVEEFGMYRALRSVGPVVQNPSATVYNDPRRHKCNTPFADPEYCDERVRTFERVGENVGCGR